MYQFPKNPVKRLPSGTRLDDRAWSVSQHPLSGNLMSENGLKHQLSVLVVDDHPLFRQAIVDSLQRTGMVHHVRHASNGLEALSELNAASYDLIMLDISMPEMDGIECMTRIRDEYPDQKVVVLTQFDSPGFYRHFEGLGVQGYLLKSAPVSEIMHTIEQVAFYDKKITSGSIQRELLNVDKTHPAHLSENEIEVVRLMCQHLSTDEIAKTMNLSPHTISAYRKHILSKIGANKPSQILAWGLENDLSLKR